MEGFRLEILMATYNGAAYLREQLDSILNQTYTDWHLTVSDDASTDETDLDRIQSVCVPPYFRGV